MITKPNFVLSVAILVLATLACNVISQVVSSTPTATPPTTIEVSISPESPATQPVEGPILPPPTPPLGVYAPAFAKYPSIAVNLPVSFEGGYTLPLDLSQVKGLDLVELSDAQKAVLAQNGFVVNEPVAGQYQEFYQVYEAQRYALDQPIFVTTDAVFHVYHLIFDKMLRDLERDVFFPKLEALTLGMQRSSQEQYDQLIGTLLEEPARRNLAFFSVAAQLLEIGAEVPPVVSELVSAEVSLINGQAGPQVSPIWDRPDLPTDKKLIEDYSQYIPRGHYTRSEALKRYFKAMMWYGRLTFRLRDAFETQRALLLTQAMRTATTSEGVPVVHLWRDIYEPTVFIVGKVDDLSYFEYGALSDTVFGVGAGPTAFADEDLLREFIEAGKSLPPPQVNSMWVWIWEDKQEATQGFRFMGQRFTLDAYVFGQLIWRNVGTQTNPRGLPKGLDFFAALGSDEALNLLDEMGETQYEKFSDQMTKVRTEIGALEMDSWTQNLYWSWLYAFEPLIQPKDSRYPAFMQTQAWTRKDLHTALASWTELKHDTLLYAKQVMAEMGGGAPEEPPHGYVEPNPEAFARLQSLAQMTYDGLNTRNLLGIGSTSGNLENLIDLLGFLKGIAEKELAGDPLTVDDYFRIQYFGGELEALTLAASDCESGDPLLCRDLHDQKAALVADVATGIDAGGRLLVLEEGVGQPTEIYVVLPDQPWRVGVGAVLTYYEFTVPPEGRMTDEEWQALVEQGSNPSAPDWTKMFIVQ